MRKRILTDRSRRREETDGILQGGPVRSLTLAATRTDYCFSYSPLFTRLRTVKPALLASETESGLSFWGELKLERILRTGFLQAGHLVSSGALAGRRNVNLPPQALQLPSHNSYS